MTYQNPKTDWQTGDNPGGDDLNRIEENIRTLESGDHPPKNADQLDGVELTDILKQTPGLNQVESGSVSDTSPSSVDITTPGLILVETSGDCYISGTGAGDGKSGIMVSTGSNLTAEVNDIGGQDNSGSFTVYEISL